MRFHIGLCSPETCWSGWRTWRSDPGLFRAGHASAADLLEFVKRQKQRGFRGTGRAVSFHESIDMQMPATTFVLFWVDGVGYWLILGGEPLLNNRALVELVWAIRAAGEKFVVTTT